jgi:small subunit ribosomal protein S6e
MAEFKLVMSNTKGQAVQKEVKDEQASAFVNKIIGDKVSGDAIGFAGYEFEITGGSDKSGFPMRRDVAGRMRRKILTTHSTGVHIDRKGIRKRKTVAANSIYEDTSQINLKVVKEGKESLFAKPEAAKEGEAKQEEQKPAEGAEAKPEKKEEKKENKKAERPAKPETKQKQEQKEEKTEEKKDQKPASEKKE